MNHHKYHYLLLAAISILLAACGNSQDATQNAAHTTNIKDMYWLKGWWQNSIGGIFFEEWNLAPDGSLVGRSGMITGTDTIISETIALQQMGDSLMYIPTVKNQNEGMPVPFQLTSTTRDSFVFENPTHDFPDKIVYKNLSNKHLTATISGKIKGEQRSAVIEMEKMR